MKFLNPDRLVYKIYVIISGVKVEYLVKNEVLEFHLNTLSRETHVQVEPADYSIAGTEPVLDK